MGGRTSLVWGEETLYLLLLPLLLTKGTKLIWRKPDVVVEEAVPVLLSLLLLLYLLVIIFAEEETSALPPPELSRLLLL